MAVSGRDRHELYRKLEGVIGKESADTMMAMLPPVGWADVATKDDLRSLEARILVQIHKEVASLSKTMVVSIVGSIATVAALAFGAAHLV
jgi:hypothetical protein